jgi:hypothetical protein
MSLGKESTYSSLSMSMELGYRSPETSVILLYNPKQTKKIAFPATPGENIANILYLSKP